MESHEGWNSLERNPKLRALQPHILINNRSKLNEDFGTPEEHLTPTDRDWEACMTFNGLSWGYMDSETRPPLQLQCPPHPQDAQYGHRRRGQPAPETSALRRKETCRRKQWSPSPPWASGSPKTERLFTAKSRSPKVPLPMACAVHRFEGQQGLSLELGLAQKTGGTGYRWLQDQSHQRLIRQRRHTHRF